MPGERSLNLGRVILQGPFQRRRISYLDESYATGQGIAEGADQSPVAMQPRQVNQRRQGGWAMDAYLNFVWHWAGAECVLRQALNQFLQFSMVNLAGSKLGEIANDLDSPRPGR